MLETAQVTFGPPPNPPFFNPRALSSRLGATADSRDSSRNSRTRLPGAAPMEAEEATSSTPQGSVISSVVVAEKKKPERPAETSRPANTPSGPGDSTTHNNVGPDAMTWASTWEMMNRTLEAFDTRNTDSSIRGNNKSRKIFKKPKEFKDYSDGCIDTWVEVMRLHLEQDNLNDEKQACTAILSNLETTH